MNRKQFFKSAGLLTLALVFSFTMGGCGRRGAEEDNILLSEDYMVEEVTVDEEQESFDAYLSYANFKYIEMGDGDVDSAKEVNSTNAEDEDDSTVGKTEKMIRKIKKKIKIEDADKKAKVRSVIDALRDVPRNEENAETFVTDQFTINSIRTASKNVVIDLSSEGLDDTNLYEEEFFIYQITDSILNTFDDIKGVRFTVDGEEADELNYIDISGVFKRADINEFISGADEDSSESDEAESDEFAGEDELVEDAEETAQTGADSAVKSNTAASGTKTNTGTSKTSTAGSSSTAKNNTSGTSTAKPKTPSSSKNNGSTAGTPSRTNNSSNGGTTAGGSTSGGGGTSSGGSTGGTGGGSTSGGSSSGGGGTSGGGSTSGGGGTSSGGQDGVVNDSDL